MKGITSIATWDALRSFGFEVDARVMSDELPGLTFDFGNFQLHASHVFSLSSGEVVLFTGVLSTPRALAEIYFEMPRRIESHAQCAAWISGHLDRATRVGFFEPVRAASWLIEGRQNQHTLPWVRHMAAYHARPHCMVLRNWLRLALKSLSETVSMAALNEPVVFAFDGEVLTMRCAGKTIALPGEGSAWPTRYAVPAGRLCTFPKRLMRERLEVSVWEGHLNIASWSYEGVKEMDTVGTPIPNS